MSKRHYWEKLIPLLCKNMLIIINELYYRLKFSINSSSRNKIILKVIIIFWESNFIRILKELLRHCYPRLCWPLMLKFYIVISLLICIVNLLYVFLLWVIFVIKIYKAFSFQCLISTFKLQLVGWLITTTQTKF